MPYHKHCLYSAFFKKFSFICFKFPKYNLVFPCTFQAAKADMNSGLTVQHLADSVAIVSLDGVVLYPCVSGLNTHIV